MRFTRWSTLLVLVVVLLAALPVLPAFLLPGVLPAPSTAPTSLQVLAVGLTFASLAMTFDILHGYTGMLSFGHVLWFALGLYAPAVLMREWQWGFFQAVAVSLIVTALLAVLVGLIALRVVGIAFAMVTLAFAEAFYLLAKNNPVGFLGGDEGINVPASSLPERFQAVADAKYTYWLALAVLVLIAGVLWYCAGSRAGRVWLAVRENAQRAESIGLQATRFRLMVFILAAVLASLAGSVYLVIVRGAHSEMASADFALLILLMVMLGGSGRLWGAALGGFVYGVAQLRLGALSTTDLFESAPSWVAGPLQEPQFAIGVLVVVLMLITPGGLAGLLERLPRRRESALRG